MAHSGGGPGALPQAGATKTAPRDYGALVRRLSLYAVVLLIYGFLLAPGLVVIVASFTTSPYLSFPPEGFTLRWYREVLILGEYISSFVSSLWIGGVATVLSLAIGLPVAHVVVNYRFPGRDLL